MKVVSRPIKVIAVFEYDNKPPIPYKFKMRANNGEELVIKVDFCFDIHRQTIIGVDSIIYECQSVIRNIERRYMIKYLVNSCKWILYKI